MSDDNKNSEPFDFDFDQLDADEPQNSSSESSFDLDNPFGDDLVASGDANVSASTGESSFDLATPYGDDFATTEEKVSAEEESSESDPSGIEESDTTKKGKAGWFSKGKSAKGTKEKTAKEPRAKKEKVLKEDVPSGEKVPRDWETILCISFSVFLLVSLLMFNIAGLLTGGKSLMQTLCFLGAINIVGLAAAAVPILFYRYPKERTLPNVMLGVAAVAMFCSLLVAVTEFYFYSFVMTP